jgi:hypothetical protein
MVVVVVVTAAVIVITNTTTLVTSMQVKIMMETERKWNSDNACNHSVQNLLSSHLLSKN